MLLTVCKYLNIRVGNASASASTAGYLSPGDSIDLDTVLIGEELDGNAIWYRSKTGYYYWSGGITEVAFEVPDLVETTEILKAVTTDILHNYSSYYRNKVPGYLGCGTGKSQDPTIQELVIAIFINQKQVVTMLLPDRIKHKGYGIKTEIIQIQPPKLQKGPFFPGSKVAVGTAGVKGFYNGEECLLSCYHVLADSLLKKGTVKVTSEDQLTATLSTGNLSATLEVLAGEFTESVDYALARLPNDVLYKNEFKGIPINGYCTEDEIASLWGAMVFSSGAYTKGSARVTHTMRNIQVGADFFVNVLHTGMLSVDGDSGAAVFTADNKLVGFVFAGDSVTCSYIIPAYKLIPDLLVLP
ncbi:hypothetical protein ACTJJ0_03310 [Chitinophaga sp. 22321]|uniref:Trypsin-like peptidase domain-containing protein n=1 Tax=Chitinophaga hostae TaxID=2831022 RepID=A0ABS5IXS9_9BACT|nr:hypothetical protein [Chitinophaga hostae]MBS0027670.1 hypothetical protein [Chitinophaga hostae]